MPSNLMALTTSDNSLAPLGGSQIDAAIDAIEPYVVLRYSTTAVRDAAHPATPLGRRGGTVVWVPAVGYHQTVLSDGGAWVPLATRDSFSGAEAAKYGAAPPAGTLKVRRDFTIVLTVQSGSLISASWPGGAFSNGLVAVVATPGDLSAQIGPIITAGCTLSEFKAFVKTWAGADIAAGSLVRVEVMAVGW